MPGRVRNIPLPRNFTVTILTPQAATEETRPNPDDALESIIFDKVHTVKFGVNYRFGDFGKGPVGKAQWSLVIDLGFGRSLLLPARCAVSQSGAEDDAQAGPC